MYDLNCKYILLKRPFRLLSKFFQTFFIKSKEVLAGVDILHLIERRLISDNNIVKYSRIDTQYLIDPFNTLPSVKTIIA